MGVLDWGVFGLYFAAVLSFAYYHSRKNVGVEGYLLANRRLPWGAIGLSVMVVAMPTDLTFFWLLLGVSGDVLRIGVGAASIVMALARSTNLPASARYCLRRTRL